MGLRFRKSITLCKGVKLNFGISGASVSVGVPGLHKTFHSSGRQTTSIGIPGTGVSYVDVDTSRMNRERAQRNQQRETLQQAETPHWQEQYTSPMHEPVLPPQLQYVASEIGRNTIAEIHAVADEPVDWTEALLNAFPPDVTSSPEKWAYFHSVASDILGGDIAAYLRVIQDVNPYDDLLNYGSNFVFGTDDASKMEVEFTAKSRECMPSKSSLSTEEYYRLLCDYICSCTLRIARDTFALLPVQQVIVHAVDDGTTILSTAFDRNGMEKLRFRFADPSEAMKAFRHNMEFDPNRGFSEVRRVSATLKCR